MRLTINTKELKQPRDFTLTSKSELFKDTEYADMDFSIGLRRVNRTDSIDILTRSSSKTDDGLELRQGAVSRDTFVESIVSWTGFVDEDGKDIECTDDMKAAIWESSSFDPLIAAIQTAIREHEEEHIAVKEHIKKK